MNELQRILKEEKFQNLKKRRKFTWNYYFLEWMPALKILEHGIGIV